MPYRFTDPQVQHLAELGDGRYSSLEFASADERNSRYAEMFSELEQNNHGGICDLIRAPHRHDLSLLEARIAEALTSKGFMEVRTPTIISADALRKMTITPDHPLYRQVFFIDPKRCLRPMLAPNLYRVMRGLRDHTDGPVRIFEIGQCFRKESKSYRHLEEFTMMNLVELGPEGDVREALKDHIDTVMKAAGLEYTLSAEASDVYVETLDVNVGDTEVASGAVGPHILDPAHDIHEPWAGAGFGLERLLMIANGRSSVRKTGKSTTYLDGYKIDRGRRMISEILESIENGERPSLGQVEELMSARGKDVGLLFEHARAARDREFGNRVYTYGFVYFSTHCRNDCTFCYYRRSNGGIARYRKTKEEIVSLAGSLKDAGVDLADLTMGEDPVMYGNGYGNLLDIVSAVRDGVGISIMASPGALPPEMFPRMREAGADFYACYQETYNRDLFSRIRTGQDFDVRLDQKVSSRRAGLLAEDGMMVGLGESVRDRAYSIMRMGELGCEQIRAMTFVPQDGTPLMHSGGCGTGEELKAIAVMRILFPDRLIPATLDVEGIRGMGARLEAGANVVTSIVPPKRNLAGVAQHELDIENGNRSVESVFSHIEDGGYSVADPADYRRFLEDRRGKLPC